ncbi:Protein P [Labeo rohita]|uniref:Protein P n=1 Tax=Labeo rohita TaxID=84645 RepID=A0ABQ8LA19_LABRO|nr:Protein P [Labeo rohita]
MISYSLFCHLRPFWVVNPTLSERDTCMCKLHENLSFLAVKLCQLKLIETANIEELIEKVCCNSSSKSCMYGECVHCKDKTVHITSAYNSTANTSFTQWVIEDKEIDKKGEKKKNYSGPCLKQTQV